MESETADGALSSLNYSAFNNASISSIEITLIASASGEIRFTIGPRTLPPNSTK